MVKATTKKKQKAAITLLAVGNRLDYDSFKKLHRERMQLKRSGWNYATVTYDRLLSGDIPKIRTKKIIVFLFFPFSYWNKRIEHRYYKGLYGNSSFFNKFQAFFKSVDTAVKLHLPDKDVHFINPPHACSRSRDKRFVASVLKQTKIQIPREHSTRDIKRIKRMLAQGHRFFLKPRFGSMGKGITFLSNSRWQTNFTFRNNQILSRKSDSGWAFKNITNNDVFLRKLLKSDIDIEEEVHSPIIKNKKFDLRIYTFLGKVFYVYPRTNESDKVTTNISQGGKGHKQTFLKQLPRNAVEASKRQAIKTSNALGLNFAGVDVIIDKNWKDVYVLDVNVFPGFPKRKRFNLARHMIKEMKRSFE
ncbi:RimK family alpha-L-glutamate ligase [Candidatus Omnitrophota bacterium]